MSDQKTQNNQSNTKPAAKKAVVKKGPPTKSHIQPHARDHQNTHAKLANNQKHTQATKDDDTDTVMLTIKMPNDLIEQLKVMSEIRGALGYRTILRNYAVEGLARDAEKYGVLSDEKLVAALQRRGAPQEALDYIAQVLKIITPPKVAAQPAPQQKNTTSSPDPLPQASAEEISPAQGDQETIVAI